MGWSRKELLKYFNTNQHTIAAHIIFEHLYPYHYKDYCVAEEELHQAMEKLDKACNQGMHFNVAKHRFYGIEFREKILHEQLGPDYYKECEYLGIRPISIDE